MKSHFSPDKKLTNISHGSPRALMYVHAFVTPSFMALIYPSKAREFGFEELFPGDNE